MAQRLDATPLTIKLALTNDQCGGLIGKVRGRAPLYADAPEPAR